MNRIEEGKRFTDTTYASKEEVKAAYNSGDISAVWDNILSYRSFFDVETELFDVSQNHYKICLTKNLLAQSYNLQMALVTKLYEFEHLSFDLAPHFALRQSIRSIQQTSIFQNNAISDSIAEKIAKNELESASSKYYPLKAYERAYRYSLTLKEINLTSICNINKLVSGSELDSPVSYRKTMNADVINPLRLPPCEDIEKHFVALYAFLKEEEIPLLLRALGIIYFFSYLRPFEFCSEETGGLVSKAFLAKSGLSYFGFFLPLESLSYTTSHSYFNKLKTSEESLDLTYFLDTTLRFLTYSFDLLSEDLKEFSLKNEERKTELKIASHDNTSNDVIVKEEPVSFALPEFPTSKSETEVEILSKKLLTIYPQLKKKQAHFYAGHCQVGLNYTIEEFRKEEKTVYETARTSMEDLANRGFYKKLQIGKKFVYTPMPLKEIND